MEKRGVELGRPIGAQLMEQLRGGRRGVAMDPQGGNYLNLGGVFSPLGFARMCQLALGSAIVSLVLHQAGYSAPYGFFCLLAWCCCLAASLVVFVLDATRLHTCLPVSWGNLTATHAALASLLYLTASVVYPAYHLHPPGCPYGSCETRNYRIAITVCSCIGCVAYGVELHLCRAQRSAAVASYMSSPPGLLKVLQAFAACVIFRALASGAEYGRHMATRYCVAVYSGCFIVTVAVIALAVSGRASVDLWGSRVPLGRVLAVYGLLAVMLYLSTAVVWPVFCFDRKYGTPTRPARCLWGRCPWDSNLVVTIFTCVNLVLYLADLVYSQTVRFISQQPQV